MNNYLINNNKENREEKNIKKKHFDFKLCKKNTINSLNEVEYFLNNFNTVFKSIKLYKILK